MVPMEGVESVAVGVYVKTGARYETKQINGISHFLEHMVFKGTKNFPSVKDTSRLEGLGAIQNAWTDNDATAYYCKIPADKWYQALDLIKDLVLYPLFPAKDLEIERGVVLEEINRLEDRPDELSGEVLMQSVFGDNPLGMRVIGTKEVIKGLHRDDFMTYHKQQYVSERLVVVFAGKIPKKENIKSEIVRHFEKLPGKKGRDYVKVNASETGSGYKIYKKKLAAQAHIQMGFRGLSSSDPRRFALMVLNSYLGYGLSSRLFTELREKRGLCYAVSANDVRWDDTGVWTVYAGLAIDKLEEAVLAIGEEIKRLTEVLIDEKELSEAKEKVRGPLLFSSENPINVMNQFAKQALDKPEEILTYDEIVNRLMQIDAKNVRQVARDLFVPEWLNLAVVGPVEEERVQNLMGKIKI